MPSRIPCGFVTPPFAIENALKLSFGVIRVKTSPLLYVVGMVVPEPTIVRRVSGVVVPMPTLPANGLITVFRQATPGDNDIKYPVLVVWLYAKEIAPAFESAPTRKK